MESRGLGVRGRWVGGRGQGRWVGDRGQMTGWVFTEDIH